MTIGYNIVKVRKVSLSQLSSDTQYNRYRKIESELLLPLCAPKLTQYATYVTLRRGHLQRMRWKKNLRNKIL